MEKPFRHADQSKALGYVVCCNDPEPLKDGTIRPGLASSRVFGTKDRATNFAKSLPKELDPIVLKVREETEREAHRWATK